MSLSYEVTVWCDADIGGGRKCLKWEQRSGKTARELRWGLRRIGWTHRDGKDLCPRHQPEPRR